MCPNGTAAPPAPADNDGKAGFLALLLLSLTWLAAEIIVAVSGKDRHYAWFLILPPLIFGVYCVARLMGPVAVFGNVANVQIQSPRFIERIRARYADETDELAALGFAEMFCFGEGFSVLRLFLIFPALVVIAMLRKGEALSLQGGDVVEGYPVFIARDGSAFASVSRMGAKFYTAFQDGTLLISKTYVIDMGDRPGIIDYAREASISDIWAEHQQQIQALEAAGKSIDRQNSFQFYSELKRKDRPAS
jgi:hypothetical protein